MICSQHGFSTAHCQSFRSILCQAKYAPRQRGGSPLLGKDVSRLQIRCRTVGVPRDDLIFGFTAILEQAGVAISMDGRGRAFDNIFVERLWRSVKYEEVYLKDYGVMDEARRGLDDYLALYNSERPHQSLGYRTPAEVYFGDQAALGRPRPDMAVGACAANVTM